MAPNDTVWNGQFNNYYIASWGAEAPSEEIRGLIKPTYFEGPADFWYVELRLSPSSETGLSTVLQLSRMSVFRRS